MTDDEQRRAAITGRRRVLQLGGLGAMAAALAACGSGGDDQAGGTGTTGGSKDNGDSTSGSEAGADSGSGEAKTLVVASFYDITKAAGWKTVVAGFRKKHPNVTVKAQTVTNSEQYTAKILAQAASGTLPDVIGCENSTIFPYFQSKGVLADLTPSLKGDAGFNRAKFYPKIIERYTVDDKVYGIPYDCQPVCGVFVNRGLFKSAGVEVPDGSWTWDEMIDLAKEFTKPGSGKDAQYGLDPGGSFLNWVYAYGGRQVDDVNHATKVTYDSEEAISGMQAYMDLLRKEKTAPTQVELTNSGRTSSDLFAGGRVAMMVGGYWTVVTAIDPFPKVDLGYVMLPAGPAGERAFQTGGTCYSVSSGSKDPDLAFEFVSYWMGSPGWKAATESGQPIYPPAFKPAYKNVFLPQKGKSWPVPNKGINGEAAQYAIFSPRDPAWQEIASKYINPDVQLMEQGKKEVTETLQGWSKDLTPKLSAA